MSKQINFKRVSVEGFGSFCQPTNFILDRGSINLIKGENGVGKTTLFSAIAWCLYKINLKGVANSKVSTWKELRSDTFRGTRVIVEFSIPNEDCDYMIVRHLDFKGTTKTIKGGNSLMIFKKLDGEETFTHNHLLGEEQYKKDQQLYINRTIGLDDRTFLNSVLFGQKMKRIIEAENDEKRKLFETLFELDFVESAKKVAKLKVGEDTIELEGLNVKIESVDKEIEILNTQLQQNLSIVAEFEETKANRLEKLNAELNTKNSNYDILDKSLQELELAAAKYDNETLVNLDSEIVILKDKIAKAKDDFLEIVSTEKAAFNSEHSAEVGKIELLLNTCREEISKLNEELLSLNTSKLELEDGKNTLARSIKNQIVSSLQIAIDESQKNIKIIQADVAIKEKDCTDLGKSTTEYINELGVNESKILKYSKEIETIDKECPYCMQDLPKEKVEATIKIIKDEIIKCEEANKVLELRKVSIEADYFKAKELLEEANKTFAEAKEDLKNKEADFEVKVQGINYLENADYAILTNKVSDIVSKVSELKELLSLKTAEKAKIELELETFIEFKKDRLNTYIEECQAIKTANENYVLLNGDLDKLVDKAENLLLLNAKYKEALDKIPLVKHSLVELIARIKELEIQINEETDQQPPKVETASIKEKINLIASSVDEQIIRRDVLLKRIDKLNWWINVGYASGGMKAFVFNSGLALLNKACEKYASRLGVRLEFSVDLTKASKPFVIRCFKGNKEIDYQELSGGQGARLNVATAFAMHDLISSSSASVNMLILDEVFEALDPKGIEDVFDLIRTKAGDNRTVYVVTHNPTIDALNTKTIEITLDENENSVVE